MLTICAILGKTIFQCMRQILFGWESGTVNPAERVQTTAATFMRARPGAQILRRKFPNTGARLIHMMTTRKDVSAGIVFTQTICLRCRTPRSTRTVAPATSILCTTTIVEVESGPATATTADRAWRFASLVFHSHVQTASIVMPRVNAVQCEADVTQHSSSNLHPHNHPIESVQDWLNVQSDDSFRSRHQPTLQTGGAKILESAPQQSMSLWPRQKLVTALALLSAIVTRISMKSRRQRPRRNGSAWHAARNAPRARQKIQIVAAHRISSVVPARAAQTGFELERNVQLVQIRLASHVALAHIISSRLFRAVQIRRTIPFVKG